jgi:hypothetical protein
MAGVIGQEKGVKRSFIDLQFTSYYKTPLQNILRKMYVNEDGCWIFTGTTDPVRGYGQVRILGKTYKVHRFVAHCFYGIRMESEFVVSHNCNRRNCINPFHLHVGDQSDNLYHAVESGRWHGKGYNDLKKPDWGKWPNSKSTEEN